MNENNTVGELLATLAVKSHNLVEANNGLVIAQIAKQDAEITLAQKTADAYIDGIVTGSNDAQRKASLASITVDETHALEVAEKNLIIARCKVTNAEIEYRTITTVINTTTAYTAKI